MGVAVGLAALLATTGVPIRGRTAAAASGAAAVGGAAAAGGAVLVPLVPCRLLDTRDGSRLDPQADLTIDVSGRCAVPVGASAVALTITVTGPVAAGFVTVYPSSTSLPLASNVNVAAGETRADGAIVALSGDGRVSIHSNVATHVVVDVSAAFVAAGPAGAAAGRFVVTAPTRLLDTRVTGAALGVAASVRVPLPATIPVDAVAAAVNITAVGSRGAGFLTAYPAGLPRPLASVLNVDGVGQTRAAGSVVTIGPRGLAVYSSAGTDLVVDLVGYFTGPSAPMSGSGLFVAASPLRVLDTRRDRSPLAAGDSVVVASQVPPGTSAVAATWTMTNSSAAGFVATFAAGADLPATSTVNAETGRQTVANFGITAASIEGLEAFSNAGTDLVVDVSGWFTGQPAVPAATKIAAAGDAVCAPASAITTTTCHHRAVSDLVVGDPAIRAFLGLGDLQYEVGALAAFQTEYDSTYGRFESITYSAPGNHEYATPGASGYYAYFDRGPGVDGRGYYSVDLDTRWHVVALNSECTVVSCAAGSPQLTWLAADLARTNRPCVIAFWHHPRFSSGLHGDAPEMADIWRILQAAGTELVLAGHDHDFERFDPLGFDGKPASTGIRSFVVGTGGKDQRPFATVRAGSAVRLTGRFGVLELELGADRYSWSFVGEDRNVLDEGSGACS